MENQQNQKRQTAHITTIKELEQGKYVKEGGWQPNYIEVNEKKISRANIIGVIISKSFETNHSLVIDDGTSQMLVRFFEESYPKDIEVGDIILLIGRPREFGNEKYIIPEIIKKIENKRWINFRKKQIELMNKKGPVKEQPKTIPNIQKPKADISITDKICALVKELDKGDGADFDSVVKAADNIDSEKIIKSLIINGELFEIMPGRIKLLE